LIIFIEEEMQLMVDITTRTKPILNSMRTEMRSRKGKREQIFQTFQPRHAQQQRTEGLRNEWQEQ